VVEQHTWEKGVCQDIVDFKLWLEKILWPQLESGKNPEEAYNYP